MKTEKSVLKIPHTLILLLSMMLVAYLATWLVPQGFFETVTLENGREAVVPGTYETAEVSKEAQPV